MIYLLPELPYAYDALEPYIDAKTMEIHHIKHHETYIENLNKALSTYPEVQEKPLITLLSDLASVPEAIRMAVRNQGGGHVNHSLFWPLMSKKGGGESTGPLGVAIKKEFGSFQAFQDQFNTAARGVFGSGWAWLCVNKEGRLVIIATANQDTPMMTGLQPVIGLDVWEHAYYLKYQSRRPDYIMAWWHVINWAQAEENYSKAIV